MRFWAIFPGSAIGILAAATLLPRVLFAADHSVFAVTATMIALAAAMAGANCVVAPLAQIFPLWAYLTVFAGFAVAANTLILSLTKGFSRVVDLPVVFGTFESAVAAGMITAAISVVIAYRQARPYRDREFWLIVSQ